MRALIGVMLVSGAVAASAQEKPFRLRARMECVGGLVAAATCVTYAPPSDGGPRGGTLRLTGVPPGAAVERALLYWTIMSSLTPVTTGSPTLDGVPLDVVALREIPSSPCFTTLPHTAGFMADVTSLVAGNGTFVLAGLPANNGVMRWTVEGATLLVVHDGAGSPSANVVIFDGLELTDLQEVFAIDAEIAGFAASGSRPAGTLAMAIGNGQSWVTDASPLFFNGWDLRAAYPQMLSGSSCPDSAMGLYDLSVFDVTGLVQSGDDVASIRLATVVDCYSLVAFALAVDADPETSAEPSALDREASVEPLRVGLLPARVLELTWEDTHAAEYQIFRGEIGSYYSHAPELCGLTSPRAELAMSSSSDYFLAVAATCAGQASSCGRDSFGIERPGTLAASGRECP